MAELSLGTFYHASADALNVSGFRFACESLLEGLLASPDLSRVRTFAIGLGPEGRARFERQFLSNPEARARCELVPLDRVSDAGLLRSAKLDVLHEMEHHLRRALAARAALALPVPVSLSTHGNRVGARAMTAFHLPLLLGDIREGDVVICASEASRAALLGHLAHLQKELAGALGAAPRFRGTIEVIPYGVSTALFRPTPRAAARAALGLPATGQLVLCHGRVDLGNKQDPAPLLLVFRRLLRRRPGQALRLLVSVPAPPPGAPEPPALRLLRERARQLGIAEEVELRAGVPRDQVPLLYAASNVAVCLSDTLLENFGLTAVEAMACAVPVVAADWAGYRDTVRHGETGLLVPTIGGGEPDEDIDLLDALDAAAGPPMVGQGLVADCDALEDALGRILDDEDLSARLGEAGLRRARERYTTTLMVERHVALWREMAARARAAGGARRGVRPPPLQQIFASYPSELLSDGDLITLSADGAALLRGNDVVLIPQVAGEPIWEAPLRALLSTLSTAPRQTAAALILQARRCGSCSAPQARRHLLWLLKQGYASRSPAAGIAGSHSRSQQRPPTGESETE